MNDADTGLTYMQQRYYDPVAGRFLSIDPVVTDANTGGSFNRYAYANNSPYQYIDPDGRNAITKFLKQTYHHRGNVVEAVYDVGGDIVTVFSPSSTPMDRIEAAISLVSPVDMGDIRTAKGYLQTIGRLFGGRKGGIDVRAQHMATQEKILKGNGKVSAGFGAKEEFHKRNGATKNRYSDGSAQDAQGREFQFQSVDTKADGTLTGREAEAAIDISIITRQPVVCVSKATCN